MISFNTHYQQIWGTRWPALENALKQPPLSAAHINPYGDIKTPDQSFQEPPLMQQPYLAYRLADKRIRKRDADRLFDFYPMDYASMLVAAALEVHDGERVLDLCAAPGGKALCLIEQTMTPQTIVLNELSRLRRKRLLQVLEDYLPRPLVRQITVTPYDGALFWEKAKTQFDKILVDVPCSGERHLMHNSSEMKRWSPKRSPNLAQRQYALLASAFSMLKPGGRIVYSTCSISPLENDGVMSKLLKKKTDEVRLVPLNLELGEATEFGWQILPDTCNGWGPMYCAALTKIDL